MQLVMTSSEYLSSGQPLDLHGGLLDDAGQRAYQRGMRSVIDLRTAPGAGLQAAATPR